MTIMEYGVLLSNNKGKQIRIPLDVFAELVDYIINSEKQNEVFNEKEETESNS